MVLSNQSTLDTVKFDASEDVLIVNQVANTNLNPVSRDGEIFLEDKTTTGTIDASDKLFFFNAWGTPTTPSNVGLLANRPAPSSTTATYYATDTNILYTEATTVWNETATMNYVLHSSEIYSIPNPVAGQKLFVTDTKKVHTYTGKWVTALNGSTVAADDNGAALAVYVTSGTSASITDNLYYYNSTDGYIYQANASISTAPVDADDYDKLSKPIIGTFANLTKAYTVKETLDNTFEIMATPAALLAANKWIDFKANVDLFDLPAGTYAYSVKTTFPDGRVVENADNATVSATGNNSIGKVTPTSLSGLFDTHWKLEVTQAVVGTYTFEFKFGPLSRTIKVIVKDNAQAKVTSMARGTSALPLFNSNFIILDGTTATNGNIVAAVTPTNVPAGAYYRITLSTSGTSPSTDLAWVDAADAALSDLVSALTEVPEVFTSLTLGRLQDKTTASGADVRAVAKLEWFEEVIIGVNLATGVQTIVYNQIGEIQEFKFTLLAASGAVA
jgi:hypothetical protein